MSDYGTVTEAGSIRFERLLPGPIERVWDYLTRSELRATWLASGPMELHVGGEVRFAFTHADFTPGATDPVPEKYRDHDNRMEGRITRCEPPRLLAHTWSEPTGGESEVTYELAAEGDKVRLVLTHRRLDDPSIVAGVLGGWHTHLDVLAERLRGEKPEPFWPRFTAVETEYERRLGAA